MPDELSQKNLTLPAPPETAQKCRASAIVRLNQVSGISDAEGTSVQLRRDAQQNHDTQGVVGGSDFYRALLQGAVQLAVRDGVRNWVKGLLDALEHAGYHPQLVVEELQVIDVAQLAVALRRQRQDVWDAVDICPRTTRSEGARLCTYARWFRRPAWRASSVLQLPLTQGSMQRLLRFRTGCHGLPRDVGGHQGVPRHQRICPLCAGGLGDEMHLVFECTALQDLRVSFAPSFSGLPLCSNSCGSQISCEWLSFWKQV